MNPSDSSIPIGELLLRHSEIFSSVSERIIICSPGGRVILSSAGAAAVIGLDPSFHSLSEIVGDAAAASFLEAARQNVPKENICVFDGKSALLSMVPFSDYLCLSVNPLYQSEQIDTQSVAAASVFDREIRLQLAAMSIAINILKTEIPESSEKGRHIFSILNQNLHRLMRITNNMSDLTQILKKTLPLNIEQLDLSAFLESFVSDMRPYADDVGIPLSLSLPAEPVVCALDSEKFKRILLNILSNSLKYTRDGNSIIISLKDFGCHFRIKIADRGAGIPPELLESIFRKYFSSQDILVPTTGAGFGLSIVRHFTELHGGSVKINSVKGEGTAIILSFPKKEFSETTFKDLIPDYSGGFDLIKLELSTLIRNSHYY